MKTAKREVKCHAPLAPPEDGLKRLRQAFEARLCSDRARLVALGSALANAATDPAPVLAEIQMFAHRLRGAAGIFEKPDIGRDAKLLELAAMTASARFATSTFPLLASALATLVDHLPEAATPVSGMPPAKGDHGVE